MTHKSDFELLEAHLTLQLKRYKDDGAVADKPVRELPQRPPRNFISVVMRCGKWSLQGMKYQTITTDVETISELTADIEAFKAARTLGYQDRDCEIVKRNKITK